jgi:hypothetical protein
MPHLIEDPLERERIRLEARRIVQESWEEAQAYEARRRNAELSRAARESWDKSWGPLLAQETAARRSRV